jgi:hypothetical protein
MGTPRWIGKNVFDNNNTKKTQDMEAQVDSSNEDFEISEEDLLQMDEAFLLTMNEKNAEHSQQDAEDQTSFLIAVMLMLLLVFGFCLAIFWFVKGYRVRQIRKRRIYLGEVIY